MTNTLHRFGPAESFADDYVVFAMCARGKNDKDALPKLKKFLEMAVPFKPVNLGDASHGGALRPSRDMNPSAHWNRDITPNFQEVIDGLDTLTTAAAVFDNRVAAEDFVKAVKDADLGLKDEGLGVAIEDGVVGAGACGDDAEEAAGVVGDGHGVAVPAAQGGEGDRAAGGGGAWIIRWEQELTTAMPLPPTAVSTVASIVAQAPQPAGQGRAAPYPRRARRAQAARAPDRADESV